MSASTVWSRRICRCIKSFRREADENCSVPPQMKSKRNNPIKTAKHHWWPGSLSKAWARGDGCVTQLRWDGEETSGDPYRFGFSKNTHHLKPGGDGGSLWDTSFEGDFQRADDAFPDLALWLSKLKVKRPKSAALSERLLAQPLPKDWRATLSECLASLIVRSPCTRNQIRALIEPLALDYPTRAQARASSRRIWCVRRARLLAPSQAAANSWR